MSNDRLKDTIEALKKICPPQTVITGDSRISEDLGLESIDFVDFIFELEKLTKIRLDIVQMTVAISEGSSKRFREVKVSDIVDYLHKVEGNS